MFLFLLRLQPRARATIAGVFCLLCGNVWCQAVDSPPALRRPVALAVSTDGKLAYSANQRSGTISIVDLAEGRVLAEIPVGKRLADIALLPDRRFLLAVDEEGHELILLDAVDALSPKVVRREKVSPYPVSVVVAPDGRRCYVASFWSRRLTVIDIEAGEPPALNIVQVINLNFAPRQQLLVPSENRLIVADAFAGRLAIFSIADMQLIAMKQFPGHNVRGLGRSPDGKKLLLSHQMLNDLAQTIRGDIHWGMLMSNDLRWLNTNSVLASGKELYFGSHMHPLGEAGRGASDPAGLDVGADGTVVIALAGVNEIAIGREADFSLTRVSVGRGPVAVKIIPPGDSAVVGNQYDDSLMVVNLKDKKVARTISLGIQPKELSLADRGELLFHDARLSHDRWMSCASCHPSGHTNGQTNDNFSDQSFGSPKRVLSLLGAKDTAPYAWNGKAETLAAQVRSSLEKTMQREEPPQADEVEAISAYLKTLELPPPVDELRGVKNEAAIHRGQRLFAAHDCARCHAPPTYTSPQTYDVGLKDDQGNTQFNPPSLRGLSHRGPYFHDNRAETLEDVFRVHHHPDATELPSAELADLIAFLRSL